MFSLNSKNQVRKKRSRIRLLFFPVLAPLFLIGWALIGTRKKEIINQRIEEAVLDTPSKVPKNRSAICRKKERFNQMVCPITKKTQSHRSTNKQINVTNLTESEKQKIYVDYMNQSGFVGFSKIEIDDQMYYIFMYES